MERSNSPSPHTYKVQEKLFKMSQYTTPNNYSMPKAKKMTFLDNVQKREKQLPGVGKYDLAKADSVHTLGLRRSFYK